MGLRCSGASFIVSDEGLGKEGWVRENYSRGGVYKIGFIQGLQ
jgi:hypothetical protein